MKTLALYSVLLVAAANAFAAEKVIYFGGATAQKAELDRCFPSFENHGYPAGADVAGVIKEINANPGQAYIVAGHSSGALYANRVVSGRVKIVNPERITLIDLDGFAPRGVPKNIKRVCWHAQGGASGKLRSNNFSSMSTANNCGEVKTHIDSHCKSAWCMHFSLVNVNAPAGLFGGYWTGGQKGVGKYKPGNWPALGYHGCSQGSLPWLSQ